jgi:hypothetical protein
MKGMDKSGLTATSEPVIGPVLIRLNPEPAPPAHIVVRDLRPLLESLERLRLDLLEEHRLLRSELESRSLEGRWRRFMAAIRRWWVGVRHGR